MSPHSKLQAPTLIVNNHTTSQHINEYNPTIDCKESCIQCITSSSHYKLLISSIHQRTCKLVHIIKLKLHNIYSHIKLTSTHNSNIIIYLIELNQTTTNSHWNQKTDRQVDTKTTLLYCHPHQVNTTADWAKSSIPAKLRTRFHYCKRFTTPNSTPKASI